MIMSDLYLTTIEVSDYNPKINDTITVTIQLLDFNREPVTGKEVIIKTTKGYFLNAIGDNTIQYTNNSTKSINGVKTNSNGKITAIYKASEWGLSTFSANNMKVQVNVTGFVKSTILSKVNGTTYDLYVDESSKSCILVVDIKKEDYTSVFPLTYLSNVEFETNIEFPYKYNPIAHVNCGCHRPDVVWGLYNVDNGNYHTLKVKSAYNGNLTLDSLNISFYWNYK